MQNHIKEEMRITVLKIDLIFLNFFDIQNPVKAGDGDSFENSHELYSQKATPQTLYQQSN